MHSMSAALGPRGLGRNIASVTAQRRPRIARRTATPTLAPPPKPTSIAGTTCPVAGPSTPRTPTSTARHFSAPSNTAPRPPAAYGAHRNSRSGSTTNRTRPSTRPAAVASPSDHACPAAPTIPSRTYRLTGTLTPSPRCAASARASMKSARTSGCHRGALGRGLSCECAKRGAAPSDSAKAKAEFNQPTTRRGLTSRARATA